MRTQAQTGAIGRLLPVVATGGFALTLTVLPCQAQAQSLGEKYWIEVSAYRPDIDSSAKVMSINGASVATNIDVESDLGLSDHAVLPTVSAGVRLGRVIIGADFYSLHRSGSRSMSRDVNFDDVTYPVGVAIGTRFNSDIYRLTVGYDVLRRKNAEFGVAVGAHVTDFKLDLDGEGTVEGTTITSRQNRRKSALAPLPTIGAFGAVELAPRLTLRGRVDWLKLSVGDYDGELWNAQAGLDYRLHRNIALGVSYRFVDYRIHAEKPDWTGRMSYRFKGPALGVRAGFP
jgi:hypothetical protein